MVWQNSVFPLLVVPAGVPGTGIYVYNGVPAAGNPPIAYIASPGVTADPYGNALPTPGGGIVSNSPGVAFSELTGGGIALGLTGGTPSAIDAAIQVARAGAGQSLQIGSGSIGADAGSLLLLNDSGVATGAFGPGLQVVSGGDGNTYDTERLTLISPGATINSAVTPVTLFSHHLGKGTYEVEVWMVTQNTTAADQGVFAFAASGGLVAGAGTLVDFYTLATGTGTLNYGASSTLTAPFNGQGVGGNQHVRLSLTVNVTTAGTLSLTGLESAAGNTVTVSAGSRMRVCPVVAT